MEKFPIMADAGRGTAKRLSRILLAEDDANDVELIRRSFKSFSPLVSIHAAHNGQDAIDLLLALPADEPRPDLILCDIKMPVMDGFQLLQWLKKHSLLRHTPVVMLSSSTMEEDVARAYEFGAAAYLVKPNTLEELQEQMKALVQFWSLSQTAPRTIEPVRAAPL